MNYEEAQDRFQKIEIALLNWKPKSAFGFFKRHRGAILRCSLVVMILGAIVGMAFIPQFRDMKIVLLVDSTPMIPVLTVVLYDIFELYRDDKQLISTARVQSTIGLLKGLSGGRSEAIRQHLTASLEEPITKGAWNDLNRVLGDYAACYLLVRQPGQGQYSASYGEQS